MSSPIEIVACVGRRCWTMEQKLAIPRYALEPESSGRAAAPFGGFQTTLSSKQLKAP